MIILASSLSACKYFHSDFSLLKPKPAELSMEPPPGPPIYQQGFRDGCESGFSGYASSFHKLFYTFKQDPELTSNQMYYRIWKDSYAYCALWGMMVDEHGLGNWR